MICIWFVYDLYSFFNKQSTMSKRDGVVVAEVSSDTKRPKLIMHVQQQHDNNTSECGVVPNAPSLCRHQVWLNCDKTICLEKNRKHHTVL